MANVTVSGFDVFQGMISGTQSRDNISFLDRKLEEFKGSLSHAGRHIAERARKFFDDYDFEGINRTVRAFQRKMESRFVPNDVRPMRKIGEFQQAGTTNIRWMHANPTFRRTWQKGRCEGWGDKYFDLEPGSVGESHTDYKKVMNGLTQFTEEGHSYNVTYFDAIEDGREELDLDQQNDIRESWDWLEHFLSLGGDDPSSPSNNSL